METALFQAAGYLSGLLPRFSWHSFAAIAF